MINYALKGSGFAKIPINYSRLRTYEAVFGQLWFGVQTPIQMADTHFALVNLGQVLGEFLSAQYVRTPNTPRKGPK